MGSKNQRIKAENLLDEWAKRQNEPNSEMPSDCSAHGEGFSLAISGWVLWVPVIGRFVGSRHPFR